jgi:hypothetical protein
VTEQREGAEKITNLVKTISDFHEEKALRDHIPNLRSQLNVYWFENHNLRSQGIEENEFDASFSARLQGLGDVIAASPPDSDDVMVKADALRNVPDIKVQLVKIVTEEITSCHIWHSICFFGRLHTISNNIKFAIEEMEKLRYLEVVCLPPLVVTSAAFAN